MSAICGQTPEPRNFNMLRVISTFCADFSKARMLIDDRNSISSTKSSSLVTYSDRQHSTISGHLWPNKNATRHLAIARGESITHLIPTVILEELRSASPEVAPIVIPITSTHGIRLHLRYLSIFLLWLSANCCEDLFGACERSLNPPSCDLQK